jgi:hypothetical protein
LKQIPVCFVHRKNVKEGSAREYFMVGNGVGKCKICKADIRCTGSNTSGFIKHLKAKHSISVLKRKHPNIKKKEIDIQEKIEIEERQFEHCEV